ncbi:ABC transporter permease [Streptomyces griseiscabiei]|uniref:ABC transporter permease n=1 Tax=Streptomyces griseiscabiei TaxID=2993540 RepID=A0ABU4L2J3_9ACTN|nr:ABC transporter permease [Streptomyces griseiscabiei]MBZ3901486.1 ABC transporter permease [Streptomyces griseiscabiei]MDX2909964.1 ABC transporter permease [Streptomyces griseiscabiei]
MSMTSSAAGVPPRLRASWRHPALTLVTTCVIGPVATVLGASFILFAVLALTPGDPVAQLLGPHASDSAREAMRVRLGLGDPLPERYWHWLTGALHGDLGTSLTYRQPVSDLLAPRLLTTLLLVGMSAVLILVAGLILGGISGTSPRWRPLVNALSGLGIAVPAFVAATILIGVFAVNLGWFPTGGAGSGFVDRLWHLTLPAVALSIGFAAYVTQLTSAAIAEEAGAEHVLTGRGRGLPRSWIFRRHILRNAALPILTASGLTVAGLVAGSVVVEPAFGIDGVGSLLIKSVSAKDYPVVTAVSVLIVTVFVVVTTLLDAGQNLLDPRLRKGR